MTSQLFSPSALGKLTLANRIVISPMCQYSAEDGSLTDWHVIHLGHLALSGAALMYLEATAVSPDGRISYGDAGLYSDANEAAMGRVLDSLRRWSDMPIGIQLAHAGRKASVEVPWKSGGVQIAPNAPGGWQTVAPSALRFRDQDSMPRAMTRDDLVRTRDDFVATAKRAVRLGLQAIEIHCAHGYLLHQFLSPLSNVRDDAYGGSLENRMQYPVEVFAAVRDAVPAEIPVTVRVSATDWVDGGWDLDQTLAFVKAVEARGCDGIDVSSGGLALHQKIVLGPGYQVPFARAVKQVTKLPVIAVGLITEPDHAESIIRDGDADFVALARGILYDARWPWHAAAHLGARLKAPPQYLRCQPREYKDLLS